MNGWLPLALRSAGVLQLVVAAANPRVVRVLEFRANLRTATPIFRHVFWGVYSWVLATVVGFGVLDLAFAESLAGAAPLGRALAALLALLWTWRLSLQLFVYDADVRRRHRAADLAFTLFFVWVASVHAVAAVVAPLAAGGAR